MSYVYPSEDLKRVLALPRRRVSILGGEDVDLVSAWLRIPGSTAALKPAQASTVVDLYDRLVDDRGRGYVGCLGVGHGKALLSFLTPTIYRRARRLRGNERTLLLVPAGLVERTKELLAEWALSFDIAPALVDVSSYELLSRRPRLIADLKPRLIVCDEAHRVSNFDGVGFGRLRDYVDEKDLDLVEYSGTLVRSGVLEWAGPVALALREGSPGPLAWRAANEWDEALGFPARRGFGALERFRDVEGEDVRLAYARRIRETPGVMVVGGSSCEASIKLRELLPPVAPKVVEALEALRNDWKLPDGEFTEDPARAVRQLACGFWYKTVGLTPEYEDARLRWGYLAKDAVAGGWLGADSPGTFAEALRQDGLESSWLQAREILEAWEHARAAFPPTLVAEWIDDSVLKASVEWAAAGPGLVWYGHRAVGDKLRELGLDVYGPGAGDALERALPMAKTAVGASIPAHGVGRNLQVVARNLVLAPPGSSSVWTQLIGRVHRIGQKANEVDFSYWGFREIRAIVRKARAESEAMTRLSGVTQLLALADEEKVA